MNASSPLGIIAGGGRLPAQLIEACKNQGRDYFILAFEGNADSQPLSVTPHAVVRIGAIEQALEHLRAARVKEIVLAGTMRRPSFSSLRPDKTGAKLLARMGTAFFSGDDALLKAIVSFLEGEGFSIIGSDSFLDGLLVPSGVLGNIKPSRQAESDIAHGLKIVKHIGQLDIGQAVIIENGYVLGVEAAEGTDALIERCAILRRGNQSGVLVKAKKPGQEERVDLPTIGPVTVEKMHKAGFSGIAVEAGGGIILDKESTVHLADNLGLFIVGIKHD